MSIKKWASNQLKDYNSGSENGKWIWKLIKGEQNMNWEFVENDGRANEKFM